MLCKPYITLCVLDQLLSLIYNYFNLYRRFPVTKYPSKYIVLLDHDHWRMKLILKSKFDLLQPRSDVDKYNKVLFLKHGGAGRMSGERGASVEIEKQQNQKEAKKT